jgi:hypothetical protein
MHRHHGITLACVVTCLASCGAPFSPGSTEVMCDCATAGTVLTVPEGLTATAITLSGDACDNTNLSCSVQTSAEGVVTCVDGSYFIHSTRIGTCHVEVDLDGHTPFTRDLHFEQVGGCCHGIDPVNGDWLVTVEAS